MAQSNYYGGAIWTNHALQRLGERRLPQDMALKALQYPDKQGPGKQSGTVQFEKKIGSSYITIVAKKNEKNEWIILSCWAEPPFAGSIDIEKKKKYLQYRDAGILGKLWLDFKAMFGF